VVDQSHYVKTGRPFPEPDAMATGLNMETSLNCASPDAMATGLNIETSLNCVREKGGPSI
jgi:hypothetical protein